MMNAKQALGIIFDGLGSIPAVITNGFLSRTAQAVAHRKQNFYMMGSMGMAPSVALGIAIASPKRKICAIDGDGAVLMNLGNMASVGAEGCVNLIHAVLDNESYESTGAQRSISARVRLERVAQSCGYRSSVKAASAAALKKAVKKAAAGRGPSFILVKIKTEKGKAAPRIKDTPEQVLEGFKEVISGR